MTEKQKTSLTKNETLGSIQETKPTDNAVFGFYNLSPLEMALRQSSFDIQEEIDIIVRHVRDPDPKVSLSALKQFRSILKDVVTMNGLVGQAKQTVDEQGTVTSSISTGGLLNSLRRENEEQSNDELPYSVLKPKEVLRIEEESSKENSEENRDPSS